MDEEKADASGISKSVPTKQPPLKRAGDKNTRIKLDSLLTKRFGEQLEALDANHDGIVDREELLAFLEDVVKKERQFKYMKVALIASLFVLLVLALTIFGTVWAVVVLSREVSSENGTPFGGYTFPSLADAATGETLRVSNGFVVSTPASNDSKLNMVTGEYYTSPSIDSLFGSTSGGVGGGAD